MNHPQRWALSAVLAGLALSVPLCAHAQSVPLYQSGTMTPNHVAKFATNGLVQDAGGLLGDSLLGKGLAPFAITDGTDSGATHTPGLGLCLNSDKTSIAYHSLCFGHSTAGAPVFALDGVEYPMRTDGGNVAGAATTTINNLAIWGDATGTLLRQATADVTGSPVATDTLLNALVINSDAVNAGANNVWGLAVNGSCCTTTAKGQRFMLGARLDITGASNAADPLPDYTAVFGNARVLTGVAAPNGTAGVWAGNFNSELGAGATGWAELQGAEFDVTAKGGSTVIRKAGISIVQGPGDQVHGTSTDSAIALYNAVGAAAPWQNILDLDNATAPVISTSGSIIHTRSPVTFADVVRLNAGTTITNGLNFTNATVTNAVLLGPGASSYISGTGDAIFSGTMAGVGNLPATFPTSLSGWALTTHFSGAEVNLWNTADAGTGFHFRQKNSPSTATIYAEITEAGALATTGLQIRVNNSGSGLSLQGVTLGAADSGGAGFRALRVPN